MPKRFTSYLIASLFLLLLILVGAPEIRAQGTIISQWQELALGGGKLIVGVNVGLVRWNEVRIEIDSHDKLRDFTLRTPNWTMAGITTDVEGHQFLVLQKQEAGISLENIEIDGPQGRGRLGIISVFLNGSQQVKVTSQPTFLPISFSPPPGGGGISPLKHYDTNKDNLISDTEFFAITDAWVANQIPNELFFQAVDLWISQSSISSAGLRFEPLTLDTTSALAADHSVRFVARGQGIATIGVEVFDLSGQRLFSGQASGSQLIWNLAATGGLPTANGIYLYRVTAFGGDPQALRSELKKLMILR